LNIEGLEELKKKLIGISVPVLGRMMHSVEGELTYTPYGKEGECNFSISRAELNKFLMTEVCACGGARA
jgi:kynurenine 3-monooxygenase